MTLNDAATAGGEDVCLNCLDGAGISHNGSYKVLSVMALDGMFYEQLEPCSCECHSPGVGVDRPDALAREAGLLP
jgi:hypothetical protein